MIFDLNHLNINTQSDLSLLYEHIREKDLFNSEIRLDFSNYSFFKPLDIIIIVVFIIYHKNNGCTIIFKHPKDKSAEKYLKDINLVEFCRSNIQEPETIFSIPRLTALPIKRITIATMNQYITLAQQYFSSMLLNKDLTLLHLSISELINNVSDHSQSSIDAYVFAQYYPRLKELKIVVADLGIGIPNSVNNFRISENQKPLDSLNALKWALQPNTTVKSHPKNAGKGLYNLLNFAHSSQCIIKIYTENALFLSDSGDFKYLKNHLDHFIGTIVEVILMEKNLPLLDETFDIDLW
jgi:hypothetical protein